MISMREAQFTDDIECLIQRQKTTPRSRWFTTLIAWIREEGLSDRIVERIVALYRLPGLVKGREECESLNEMMEVVDRYVKACNATEYVEFVDDANDHPIPVPKNML